MRRGKPRALAPLFGKKGKQRVNLWVAREWSIEDMPVISMFYGIIIRMYFLEDRHHGVPHIHAGYSGSEASIRIDDGEVLAGDLPRKQLRLVQAWIELHRDELMANWELTVVGEHPYKIDPL